MADVLDQDQELDKQFTMDKRLTTMRVGEKMAVTVNGVKNQCDLYCIERLNNPIKLRFTLMYYGVATGKEVTALKALNKWEFK